MHQNAGFCIRNIKNCLGVTTEGRLGAFPPNAGAPPLLLGWLRHWCTPYRRILSEARGGIGQGEAIQGEALPLQKFGRLSLILGYAYECSCITYLPENIVQFSVLKGHRECLKCGKTVWRPGLRPDPARLLTALSRPHSWWGEGRPPL